MTEPRHVSLEEVRTALRTLVQERPNFVYAAPDGEHCVYAVEEGGVNGAPTSLAPSCGVGYVLFRLDPKLLELAHVVDPSPDNDRYTGVAAIHLVPEVGEKVDVIFEPAAVRLLNWFQGYQDSGLIYRAALEAAEREMKR